MQMSKLLALLLFFRGQTEVCPNSALNLASNVSTHALTLSAPRHVLRPPHSSLALADIIGLEEAKAVLHEAIILPSSMTASVAKLFWRSGEHTAVLLVGPAGLGKSAAAEAAAAAVGARVLLVLATEVANNDFCKTATNAAASAGQPVVVILEALETAPTAALAIRRCLRETLKDDSMYGNLFIVATMGRELRTLGASDLVPFGYIARLGLPTDVERKQFLLRLLAQISRIDPQWASALREAAMATLTNLTANYTFAEIELVVRRAFIRSTNIEGVRDPVSLHHFEKILADTPPQAAEAFNENRPRPPVVAAVVDTPAGAPRTSVDSGKKKSKDAKDPMDGIFGWCNFWLPEALHLPPVVWAMIIFGILAHFMARSTYQPYGQRKRRGAGGNRGSLFNDVGSGANSYPSFGDQFNDWLPGGSAFANFPPPPGATPTGDPTGLTATLPQPSAPASAKHPKETRPLSQLHSHMQ